MKPTKFHYPDWLNQVAKVMGTHRTNSCINLQKEKPEYIRPSEYDVTGALGELIFLTYLTTIGTKYEANLLFADNPVIGYDVKVEDKYLIDVKTIGKDTRFLSVSTKSHKKDAKEITHYVFIKLHGQNVCDIYRCEKKEVESWKIGKTTRTNGISEYFKFTL